MYKLHNFLKNNNVHIFFLSIDLSSYSVHKNDKIQNIKILKYNYQKVNKLI